MVSRATKKKEAERRVFDIFINICNLKIFPEPETSVNTTDDVDSVINQDGWLNSLTFEKLTTTVRRIEIEREKTDLIDRSFVRS